MEKEQIAHNGERCLLLKKAYFYINFQRMSAMLQQVSSNYIMTGKTF